MQAHYVITRLTLRPDSVAQALPAVDHALAAEHDPARSRLLAVWTSELAAWEAALPARIAVSPVVTIAYALDGAQPRMLHIWPYRDLNERARIRGDTVAQGIWPPKGGAGFLTTMRSSIYLPAPFSPLQ